jgi:hypothetical protein
MEARLNLFASPVTANAVKHIIAAGKVLADSTLPDSTRMPSAPPWNPEVPGRIGQTAERSSVRRRRSPDCSMAGGL